MLKPSHDSLPMASAHRLIWTALPQGMREGTPWLLAYASIRLNPAKPTKLGMFPPFLDWPKLVEGATFGAVIGNAYYPLEPVFTLPGVSDEDMTAGSPTAWWQAMFDEQTPVNPHAVQDLTKANILSFDLLGHAAALKNIYAAQAAATVDNQPPSMETAFYSLPRKILTEFNDLYNYFGDPKKPDDVSQPAAPHEFIQ